jgi:hypothetical protein
MNSLLSRCRAGLLFLVMPLAGLATSTAQVVAAETETVYKAARSVHLSYPAPGGDLF